MNHHFAASWLQSLSGKLESLTEWSWARNKQDSCTTHRNLFREFFSAPFQKTLALVDEQKKTDFLGVIERNLYKFDDGTQQFPLGCLCALLQHGKDSPQTQEKVVAWVDFLLERLRTGRGDQQSINPVVEECLSAPFQKFVPLMEEGLRERLADGLGEHLGKLDEAGQKRILDNLSVVPARVEGVVANCTKELNSWLVSAPRFPATPLALADALGRMGHPLVRHFTAVKDPTKKESFLVAVALALQGLRTRFRWMCAAEPDLEALGAELQRRLFTVEGQGPVMEMWLSSRLKRYNAEVATRTANLVASDPSKYEQLRTRLQPLFPERADGTDPESGWIPLDGPTSLGDTLLGWLTENSPGFFCPQHTLARETLTSVLQRFGNSFETDVRCTRARLGLREPPPPPPKLFFPPQPPGVDAASSNQLVPAGLPGAQPPVMVPPAMVGANLLSPAATASLQALRGVSADVRARIVKVDNLIDFLLNEALEGVSLEARAMIVKVGHGVYRFGSKEVTLHTQNGRLYVYRIGELVRHMPVVMFLQEEGLRPLPAPPATAAPGTTAPTTLALTAGAAPALMPMTSPAVATAIATAAATAGAAVDTSSVARIALQSKQISAGVTTTTTAALQQPALPFGLSRPPDQKSDAQALMSKRVEAATKAMDVSKQIVRRLINFEDEKFLKKLLSKGLKHDKQWQTAYQEFCAARGVPDLDQKSQDKELIATFIERNLANSINQDWAKKIIYTDQAQEGGEKKEKKEKKEKRDKDKDKDKDKKKRDKKRKASESSDSNDRAGAGLGGMCAMGGTAPGAMELPVGMPMYGPPGAEWGPPGMPLGMGGGMGMGMGMPGMPMGLPMLADGTGMPGMGMDMMEDARARKRPKQDKQDKQDKADRDRDRRKAEKSGKTRK